MSSVVVLLFLVAAVIVIRAGGPRPVLEAARERLTAAGNRAAQAPGFLARSARIAVETSWWVRLALALGALALAPVPPGTWLGFAGAGVAYLLLAAAVTRIPFLGRRLAPVARWIVTAGGWLAAFAVAATGLDAGGPWGILAAVLGGWALWGAVQNRTIVRALKEGGHEPDRIIEVSDTVIPKGGGHDDGKAR